MDPIITQTAILNTTAEEAFKMFTENELLESWLTVKADVEPKPGGKYELFWEPNDPENNSTIGCKVLAEEGGIYAVIWGSNIDNPDYITVAKIAKMVKPELLLLTDFQYRSKDGSFPFDADLNVEFTLKPVNTGTKLCVNQMCFPDDEIADEFYNSCIQGWSNTMTSFKKVVEKK